MGCSTTKSSCQRLFSASAPMAARTETQETWIRHGGTPFAVFSDLLPVAAQHTLGRVPSERLRPSRLDIPQHCSLTTTDRSPTPFETRSGPDHGPARHRSAAQAPPDLKFFGLRPQPPLARERKFLSGPFLNIQLGGISQANGCLGSVRPRPNAPSDRGTNGR